MTRLWLVDPDVRFHQSFLAAYDELVARDEERHVGLPTFGWGPDSRPFTREVVDDPAGFAAMVDLELAVRDPATPRPRQIVPWTELWLTEDPLGSEWLGRVSVRHELTEVLLEWGGHVGYALRPSARGRGLAAEALRQVLPRCRALGIDRVLVTCDVDNTASRLTIERCGGVYEDTREGKLRYWIDAR